MKKKFIIAPLVLSSICALGFTGCKTVNKEKSVYTNSDIIFTECVEGSGNSKAIELYNLSDNDIDLTGWQVSIYVKETKTYNFDLTGTLKSHETYVLASSNSDSAVLEKANLVDSKVLFMGSNPIRLYKNGSLMDIMGTDNTNLVEYAKNVTMVRKAEYLQGRSTFDEYEWIYYNVDDYSYLGNVNTSVTEDELRAGPSIDDSYLSLPYAKYISTGEPVVLGTNIGEAFNTTVNGAGGLVDVTLYRGVDGDTANFNFSSAFKTSFPSTSNKVRFQGIDTRESYAGNVQEFGIPAKFFTTNILENATDIQIQSAVDGLIVENNGRYMGWVWADGELVNWKVCERGYSDMAFDDVDTMFYKGLSYAGWLKDAVLYAKRNSKGIWGEKDPYWDYDTNTSTWTGETLSPEEYE